MVMPTMSANQAVSSTIAALMMKVNSPSVRQERGMEKKLITGRMKAFTRPKMDATTIQANQLPWTSKLGTMNAAAPSATALMRIRITSRMIIPFLYRCRNI
jgi:hypothetical protein